MVCSQRLDSSWGCQVCASSLHLPLKNTLQFVNVSAKINRHIHGNLQETEEKF